MKSRRARAVDIPAKVKRAVFERDGGRCVLCGCSRNVMPNAHFIPRSKGGLGIEENIVTLCTSFTENRCHERFDFGSRAERAEIESRLEEYLRSIYPDWDREGLVYRK